MRERKKGKKKKENKKGVREEKRINVHVLLVFFCISILHTDGNAIVHRLGREESEDVKR